jgi:hypothetical protein
MARPLPQLRRSLVARSRALAVLVGDAPLALAADRLEACPGDREREARALLAVYDRALRLGRRAARIRRRRGPVAPFCRVVREELARAHDLGSLALEALEALGRAAG